MSNEVMGIQINEPQGSIDARVWAAAFMAHWGNRREQITGDIMEGWFANAIAAGFDNAQWRYEKK